MGSKTTSRETSRRKYSVEEMEAKYLPPQHPESAAVTADDEVASVDPWDIVETEDTGPKWKDISPPQKVLRVFWVFLRIFIIVAMLYFFICSLDVLQNSFQLIAGRAASRVFDNNVLINNPVSALMIGVLVTVLVQSSSTSTSIVVSMVGSHLLTVQQAIPIIFGTNIGTTVSNTIVALTQSADRDNFRRAFAGATVHDAFNWLTVLVLLPLECASHYLFHLTEALTRNIVPDTKLSDHEMLNALTDPFTKLILQLDEEVLQAIVHQKDRQKFPIAKYYCKEVSAYIAENHTTPNAEVEHRRIQELPFTYDVQLKVEYNATNTSQLTYNEVLDDNSTKCSYLFHGTGTSGALPEPAAGGILLVCSLLVMTFSLLIMVKVLNSLLKGPMAKVVRKVINADFPGCFSYFTGYVAILFGMGITIVFQSSSVFTSTLTPLVGIGVVSVERMYPLTLGSNIGTTVTSILAALAGDPSVIKETLQVSFCHLFFNISGIVIFYPFPFMRIPIALAKRLGMITARYRWFAIVYLVSMFLLFPLIVFGLSMAGWYVLLAIGVPFLLVLAFVIIVNVLQAKRPDWLPRCIRTWQWLPRPLRSLEPYDKIITGCCRSKHRCCCCKNQDEDGWKTTSSADWQNDYSGKRERENETDTRNAGSKAKAVDKTVHGRVNENGFDNATYEEPGDEMVYNL